MRRHDHRAPQLTVHTEERVQEVLLSNGIELRRRLVEQQDARLHGKRGRQRQQLLAPARKRVHIVPEPVLHAEEVAGLGHAAPHGALLHPQVFQAERHLMPHALAHELVVGVLKHVADGARGLSRRIVRHRPAKHEQASLALARRCDLWLQQREQGGLAAAGTTHEQGERSLGNLPGKTVQHGSLGTRIGEREILDLESG